MQPPLLNEMVSWPAHAHYHALRGAIKLLWQSDLKASILSPFTFQNEAFNVPIVLHAYTGCSFYYLAVNMYSTHINDTKEHP